MNNKFLVIPIIGAILLGGLTACSPVQTKGTENPTIVRQSSDVLSVHLVQPDAVNGADGIIYAVQLKSSITNEEYAATANTLTKDLALKTPNNANWGMRFRSGVREIGMSQAAYLQDHPELVVTTPAPSDKSANTVSPEAKPAADAKDSYALQLSTTDLIMATKGALAVKSYDALAGYVSISFEDQAQLETFYQSGAAALDKSGWKQRGDFSLNLNVVHRDSSGVITPTGVVLNAAMGIQGPTTPQPGGLSALLSFPTIATQMYRAVLAVPKVEIAGAIIGSRGLHQEVTVIVPGSLSHDKTSVIYGAFATIQDPEARFVQTNVISDNSTH